MAKYSGPDWLGLVSTLAHNSAIHTSIVGDTLDVSHRPRGLMAKALDFGSPNSNTLEISGSTPDVVVNGRSLDIFLLLVEAIDVVVLMIYWLLRCGRVVQARDPERPRVEIPYRLELNPLATINH
ncbi:hypothetical protein BKA56DRAFT_618110 [Ilyonectria sp. MPI-CAGE-AT-0026]|nr:hypothetical protein BKA56DRAFT_618110 [Ilyonectria sp. MPI-CAGE-AT-0026]